MRPQSSMGFGETYLQAQGCGQSYVFVLLENSAKTTDTPMSGSAVKNGILPCVWITGLNKEVYIATKAISDLLMLKESPAKSERKVVLKDQLRFWSSLYNWFVCLKILIRESLFYVNKENWDQSTPSNSPRALGTKSKFGKEMVHREGSSRGVVAPRRMRPQSGRFGEKYLKAQEFGQSYVSYSRWSKGNASTHFEQSRWSRIRSRFRKISAHDEPKRPKLRWIGHSKKVQNPIGVLIANREMQTLEAAQVFAHDLKHWENSVKTTDTLMSGSAVKNHGWPKRWRQFLCKADNFVPRVVPGLSTSSGSNSSSTSPTQDSSSSSSSLVLERSDGK